jgi:proteasome accessory factor C
MNHTLAFERLRRLLFVVPFVSKHQGLTVAEVAEAVGCSKAELLEELDLLTLVGRPPFQPDDFIDIYVEEDRVYLELDQRLSAPPRLTAAEGVALAAAAALLKPASGGALASGLQKLENVLPPQALIRYRDMARLLDVSADGPDSLATISQAILEHRELELEYISVGKGEREQRRVHPLELFSHRGQWYLQAFCTTRQSERLFRVDRMGQVTLTATHFAAPAESERQVPGDGNSERPVTVCFSRQWAAYQLERFGESAVLQGDGSVLVTVPGDSERWLTRWVLSFGGNAWVVEPAWAREAVARAAAQVLQNASEPR